MSFFSADENCFKKSFSHSWHKALTLRIKIVWGEYVETGEAENAECSIEIHSAAVVESRQIGICGVVANETTK